MIHSTQTLFAELQKLIEGLPDDAIKVVLELSVDKVPLVTVTRATVARGAIATATMFKVSEISHAESS